MSTVTTKVWSQPSPLGWLEVEMSPAGIRRLWIRRDASERGLVDAGVSAALDAYLAGDLGAVDGLNVDLSGCRPLATTVLGLLRLVPAGNVTTYGGLAAAAGRPGAARAVGQVVAANPVAIVVPCHRV
ncbi:MAG: methylated-DNA--[protein]-cysteine S-methyltransferase, partial [Acidimicrobiales bacterium]